MSDNLDTLRKTAKAATPGPWEVWKNVHCDPVVVPAEKPWAGITDPKMPFEKVAGLSTAPDDYGRANLEYIATFDPPTVLALLSRLEQAEQAVARVRAKHSPVPARYYGTDLNPHRKYDCDGCGEGRPWPCSNIRALDGDTK